MEAAEVGLEQHFKSEGLLPQTEEDI